MKPTQPKRDLVLIGGGHAHALVLRQLAMKPIADVRVTLISDQVMAPYSGMLPGYLAGHYSLEDCHINLHRLCQVAGVRFIQDRVTGIDLERNAVLLQNEAPMAFDKASINVGSTPNLSIPGSAEHGIGVKPISRLAASWQRLMSSLTVDKPKLAIVGAGAAGVEVALAIAWRFKQENRPLECHLVFDGEMLPTYTQTTRAKVLSALKKLQIQWVAHFDVAEVTTEALISRSGKRLPITKSLWCTPAQAPEWPKACGLKVDAQGFIQVNRHLQSTSHSNIFAVGDVASLAEPRPKAGVFSVRSAPFLAENLRRSFAGQPLKPLRLQTRFLSLLALGGKVAVAERNGITLSGGWVWHWKNHIDRAFMAQFSAKLPKMPTMPEEFMHCAGCGSKLGPQLLADTLDEMNNLTGANPEDAAIAWHDDHQRLWQSIDGFRSFTDNVWRLAQVAVHHAVNDCYAMGIQPASAQVWANLEFLHPRLTRRDFKRLMLGLNQALSEHETPLIGGHSTEGEETHLALVVNGAEASSLWTKRGAKAGDWLLLNKPLGSGVLLAAEMHGRLTPESYQGLWQQLLTSNRAFFQAMATRRVHAATDITGFGLIGHLLEMFRGTGLTARINAQSVPLMTGALAASQSGIGSSLLPQLLPLLHECDVAAVDEGLLRLLLDPQTNGGLLIACAPDTAQAILDSTDATKIGEVANARSETEISGATEINSEAASADAAADVAASKVLQIR